MESITCTECGLIVLISAVKIEGELWEPNLEDRNNFLCYFCYEEATDSKKYRVDPHKPKQENGIHIKEEDPYESLGNGEYEESKQSTKIKNKKTV